jgi:hypothetical protein
MQDFFICEAEYDSRANVVGTTSYKKLVVDMYYEVRIQSIITFHASALVEKDNKDARTMSLTQDQYL